MIPECCVQAEVRRRLSDERASTLLSALLWVRKARSLEKVKEIADGAIAVDAVFWRADEAVKDEESPAK